MLNYDVLAQTPVMTAPFPYMTASHVLGAGALAEVTHDFPLITGPGVYPLDALHYGAGFARLVADLQSEPLEALLQEKFQIDLSDKPLMITVRGYCQKRDGRIHTDSRDKVLTCLLYLNASSWPAAGGCLRLLRDGKSLRHMLAEVPPVGGNFIAFQRTDHSWHGHAPFVGQRRAIMFNWMRSSAALNKNIGRHKLSAALKKIGLPGGAY